MAIAFQCRCGALQGELDLAGVYTRATCHCRDCQAFARALGRSDVLDAAGGTDVLAMLPSALRITTGQEHLACLSLGPKGLYRWHAACCATPIANTPRDPGMAYVGVLASCVADPLQLDGAMGPSRAMVGRASATAPVRSTPLQTTWTVIRTIVGIVGARLRGRHRPNPFFEPGTAEPIRAPRILTREERAAASTA